MPRIKSIEFTKRGTLIRVGKNMTEIPGDKRDFRQWIRDTAAQVTDEHVLALQLREHIKNDPEFANVATIVGKDIEAALTVKAAR